MRYHVHSPDQQNKNGSMYKADALIDGVREEKLSFTLQESSGRSKNQIDMRPINSRKSNLILYI